MPVGTPVIVVIPNQYVDQAYLELIRGVDNMRVWSNKGGNSAATDVPAVNEAVARAQNKVNSILGSRYSIPLTNVDGLGGDISADDFATIRRLAEPIASFELYRARGLKDRDPVGKLLQQEYTEALDELEMFADLANGRILRSALLLDVSGGRAPELVV